MNLHNINPYIDNPEREQSPWAFEGTTSKLVELQYNEIFDKT
jgi:hypothetical protein